jgi:hypothetical protein
MIILDVNKRNRCFLNTLFKSVTIVIKELFLRKNIERIES